MEFSPFAGPASCSGLLGPKRDPRPPVEPGAPAEGRPLHPVLDNIILPKQVH
jgi:hypothetical protein